MRLLAILFAAAVFAAPAMANEGVEYPKIEWHQSGPFGTFDRAQLQRGFQVYKQVCAACHSMRQLSYRNLEALGYDEGQVKAIASEYMVTDGPNDQGEMFERAARPSDKFKSPFANEQAARAANGGALPKDLSLMVKARHGREDYVHALLTGYTQPPEGFTVPEGMHYNKYFEGHLIGMPAPLVEGAVSYADGTEASVDQMAKDVATFLAWAAEPEMETRKKMGMQVILFLAVFSVVMYLAKKEVWKKIKH